MSKRVMIDPALLTKPWYRKLRTPEKLAFIVILCVCDEVGIWTVDQEWVEMLVGQRVDWESLTLHCNGNLAPFDEKHVLIPDYFRFQYPRASRKNQVTKNLFKRVDELGLHGLLGLPNLQSLDTVTVPMRYRDGTVTVEEDKDKDKDKESSSLSLKPGEDNPEDLGEERAEKIRYDFATHEWVGISDEQVGAWREAFPACKIERELIRAAEWLEANPKQKKSNYQRFLFNWLTRSQDKGGTR